MGLLNFHFSANHFKKYLLTLIPLTLTQIATLASFLVPMMMIGRTGDTKSIAVIGLFNFLIFLTYIPVSTTIIDVSSIYFATFYGAKKYDKFIDYVYKTLLTFAIQFVASFILFYFSADIFILAKIDPEIAIPAGNLLIFSMFYLSIYSLSGFLQGYLSSQNVHKYFDLISVISMISTLFFCYYFIVHREMLEYGYIPARFCQEVIVFALYVILVYYEANPKCIGCPDFDILFVDFLSFFYRITISSVSVLAEFIAFEYNTYLAARLGNIDEFAVWEAWAFSQGVSFFLSQAVSSTIRKDIGHIIGSGNMRQAKEETIAYFVYTFIFGIVIEIFYWNFAPTMAAIFFKDPNTIERMTECLKIYIIFIYFYLIFYPIFMVFRLLKLDTDFLKIIAVIFPVLIVLVNTPIFLYTNTGVVGLVVGHILCTSVICVLCLIRIFWAHNWMLPENADTESLMIEMM